MSFTTKRTVWLGLAGLAILGAMAAPAHAQRGVRGPMIRGPVVTPYPVNPNGFLGAFPTAQQTMFNSRVIGQSIANIPPYAFGFNPYPSPIINSGPIIPYGGGGFYGGSPASATLSTSPYGGGYGSTLSTSPYGGYSMSTSPYGGNFANSSYGGGWGSYDPTGLQGLASYTQAQGNYKIQIMQARLLREQARQANIDTARKQIQFEAWYESMKMTAPKLRDQEMATALDRARKDPPATEIWSGTSLNELLRSIQKVGRNNLKSGPQVDLSDVNLDAVNLTDKTGQGNAGMLKAETKDGKLAMYWPSAFETPGFSEPAKQLTQSLSEAVAALKKKEKPASTTLKDVQNNYRILSDKLTATASTDELSPSQYIEAKRYLRQLDQAIKALNDPKASNYFDDWKAKGRTVSELVDHMMKNGLSFAPATSGDEAAYSALYQALRQFEGGLTQKVSQKD
jgi:hypothetical protein